MDSRPPPSTVTGRRLSPLAACERCGGTQCEEHCACSYCRQQCNRKPRGKFMQNGKELFDNRCSTCHGRKCPAGKQAKLAEAGRATGQKKL